MFGGSFLRFGDDSSDRFCDDPSLLLVIPPAAGSIPSSGSWSPYPACHTRRSKVLLRHVILGSYVTKGPDPPSLIWLRCYMSEQPLPPSPCSTCLGSSLFLTCMLRLEAEFTSVSWWPSGAAAAVRRRSYVASHPAFSFSFPSSLPSLSSFFRLSLAGSIVAVSARTTPTSFRSRLGRDVLIFALSA